MDKIQIRQLFDYETCTYTYVLWDFETKDAIIIDPVLEQVERDFSYLKKLKLNLKYILETHIHADHITGASKLKQKTNAEICYGSKTGVEGADILLNDGDKITIDITKRTIDLEVSEHEIKRRKDNWVCPQARYTRGVLAKYAKSVSSASLGAVTDLA